jgi:hypothetical protein
MLTYRVLIAFLTYLVLILLAFVAALSVGSGMDLLSPLVFVAVLGDHVTRLFGAEPVVFVAPALVFESLSSPLRSSVVFPDLVPDSSSVSEGTSSVSMAASARLAFVHLDKIIETLGFRINFHFF